MEILVICIISAPHNQKTIYFNDPFLKLNFYRNYDHHWHKTNFMNVIL